MKTFKQQLYSFALASLGTLEMALRLAVILAALFFATVGVAPFLGGSAAENL